MDMGPCAQRLREPVSVELFDLLRCTNDDTDAARTWNLMAELEVLDVGPVLAAIEPSRNQFTDHADPDNPCTF